MKLKELKSVLHSTIGQMQWCIVYDWENNRNLENGCSIEYAMEHYGGSIVRRIYSHYTNSQDYLIVEI